MPEIWSLGHRNVQGAALHPATGELWTNEHGPKGGDELNRTLGGRNYGWPLVTYGTEYSGEPISDHGGAGPRIAGASLGAVDRHERSGVLYRRGNSAVDGQRFRRRLEVGGARAPGTARGQASSRRSACSSEALTSASATVVNGPDGALYLLTDEAGGQLLRVTAAP